jgi:hypothetical protein
VVAEWVVGDGRVATASQIASKCRPTTHIRDACTECPTPPQNRQLKDIQRAELERGLLW